MSSITGTIQGLVRGPSGSGKRGPWQAWSVQVDGKKYGTGFEPVKEPVGTRVVFDVATNEKGYEEVQKGTMRVLKAATPETAKAAEVAVVAQSNNTNSSIENQVALKAAVEIAVAGGNANSKAVESLFKSFQSLLQPKAAPVEAPKPAPKRIEPEDVNQDDSDLPY